MLVPLEIIDHIFSFLSTDLNSLERCSIADPVLAPIAERYFYHEITLTNHQKKSNTTTKRILEFTYQEMNRILSKNPLIASYVMVLKLHFILLSSLPHFINEIVEITPLLPSFPRIQRLILWFPGLSLMSTKVIAALDRYMLSPSLTEVVFGFKMPLHIFSNWKNIKSLTLSASGFAVAGLHSKQPVHDTTDLQLESLSINNIPNTDPDMSNSCLLWARCHFQHLQSLSFHSPFNQSLRGLFEVCSATLTSLELDFGPDDFQTTYKRGVITSSSSGVPFDLSSLPHLKELTIHPYVKLLPNLTPLEYSGSNKNNYRSSLPAIIKLAKTSTPLQRLVLVFEFKDVVPSTLPKIDLSSITIFAKSSFMSRRMEIRMNTSVHFNRRVPAATVLSYLRGDKELVRLYRQDVLFIPQS